MKLIEEIFTEPYTQSDQNIPDEISSQMIRDAVQDYRKGDIEHRFIDSRDYDVIIDGERYPPKAIVGLASRYIYNRAHFSAGLGKKCFKLLEERGFPILPKSDEYSYPDEIQKTEKYIEGAVKKVLVNNYERDDKARDKCLEHYGTKCSVCNFDFGEVYGDIGAGFIHVHHLKQISDVGKEYEVDPIEDLRPVCPNCHAMLHKRKEPYSIEELKYEMAKR